MVKTKVVIFLALLWPIQCFAIDSYKCIVTDTNGLSENGALEPDDFSLMALNTEFVVDKGTGRISGVLSNYNAFGQPEVLDYGSTEQAYKALTIYKPFTTVEFLYIAEFNPNPLKPFMLIDGSHIFSGTCEAY